MSIRQRCFVLRAGLAALFMALTLQSTAILAQQLSEGETAVTANQPVSAAINSDPCIKCHKRNGKMAGKHADDGLGMSCSSCHGEKGTHPKKPNELVIFGMDKASEPALQQAACEACHNPAELGAVEWTHNVHALKVPCAGCHTLHTEQDPMMGMTPKVRSDLCRNCHIGLEE